MENERDKEVIDTNLLILFGGVFKNYDKDEYIFKEGQHPHFYHQLVEGKVRMVNEVDNGKDFIQGFFTPGQSFGEPPIFIDDVYPASAITVQPSVVIRLNISSFKQLLKDNFEAHLNITRLLSQRLKNKSNALKEISLHTPEHRILFLLSNLKKELYSDNLSTDKMKVEYTRKQIADMTGLRVETVIRVMRGLFEREILTIEKGKVYF